MAGDARMVVEESPVPAPRHLIIAPYPNQYVSDWMLEDGTPVKLRPMKPEDEPLVEDFLAACSDDTIYFRYFRRIKKWTHDMLIRFTQNDYDRETGLMAVGAPPGPRGHDGGVPPGHHRRTARTPNSPSSWPTPGRARAWARSSWSSSWRRPGRWGSKGSGATFCPATTPCWP